MKAIKAKKKFAKARGKRIAKRDFTQPRERILPTLCKTDVRSENLPLADLVPFSEKDIKVKKCHYEYKNHKIPFLRIHANLKEDITIDVYGSHFESPEDKNLTYLIHNSGKFKPTPLGHFENPLPIYVRMISISSGWKIESLENRELVGDSFKTVFQGFKGDNEVFNVLSAVREIKSNSEPYPTKELIRNSAGKLVVEYADGSCLMDFLRPVIKTNNYKRLKLIEKCIKFLESPTQTKMERTFKAIKHLCEKFNRPPTPKEIFEHIYPDTQKRGGQYRDIYRDLRDLGLGWLIKKY